MSRKDKMRTCVVCGTKYEYCPHCSKDAKKEPWHFSFHDEPCFKLYYTISSYAAKELTVEEAAQELTLLKDKINLDSTNYSDFLVTNIQEIFSSTKAAKRHKATIESMPQSEINAEVVVKE